SRRRHPTSSRDWSSDVCSSDLKTLIQHLIRWAIATGQFEPEVCSVLQSILDTRISPELVPDRRERGSQPVQHTEEVIGPFALQEIGRASWREGGERELEGQAVR